MRIVIYGGFQQAMEMSFWVPLKSIKIHPVVDDHDDSYWSPLCHRKTTGDPSMFQYVPINPTNSPVETGDFSKKITGSSNESTSYYSWSKCPIRSRWETLCQVHQVQCPGDRPRSSAASDNPWLPDICNNLPKGKSHWIPWNLVRYHQILLNPIQSH